ncbi:MAG: hypothetical protein OEV92_08085 [Nitrospinota bacterium]|nr:hypothetical protein [Nitrospinota bacterium]
MNPGKMAALALALALAAPNWAWPAENRQAMEREAVAVGLSRKAAEAARRKAHQRALALHQMAARARAAMDDASGAIVEIHNCAVDLVRLNRPQEAMEKINSALEIYEEEKKLQMGRDREKPMQEAMARVTLLRAIILADQGQANEAGQWAGKAMEYCRKADCLFKGRILNLQGRAALLAGDHKQAASAAREALEASGKEGDEVESANAARIMAQAAEAGGEGKKAYAEYKKALVMDRALKMGPKIAMDLMGLARASAMEGNQERARIFAKKALAVAEAADYQAGAEAARAWLEKPAGE